MNNQTILARIALVKKSTVNDMRQQWQELFDTPPQCLNRAYLESRLIYRIQELAHGGLKDDTLKRIKKMQHQANDKATNPATTKLMAGTVLVRHWQEAEHRVRVLDDGFEYLGQQFRSLSAIARQITGTQWNGPLFFGLRKVKS